MYSLFIFLIFLNFFKSKIFFSDNANVFNIIFKIEDINDEYIICGIWYNKLYEPLSVYILWIVESLKNNALIVKKIIKEIKNKSILIILEL